MQTAEHRSDDNRLARVVMANARRHALPDPLTEKRRDALVTLSAIGASNNN
jgi:hypothetical protein